MSSAAELRVIGANGTVASTVELVTARYDVTQRRLVATTAAGNTECSGGQAPASGQVGLQIDGNTYAVQENPPGGQDVPINIAPATAAFTLGVNGAVSCAAGNGTAADLKLVFEDGTPLTIAEAVYFDPATRTFRIRVTEPVLCNSYATGGTGLSIELTEANGIADTIAGFESVNYELSGATLRARSQVEDNGGRAVQCFNFAGVAAAPGASPSGSDGIFGSRFEYDDVAADLAVSASPANVSVLAGGPQSFQYTLTVVNTGNGTATGVRAREYLPSADGATVAAGAWTCARYVGNDPTALACATAAGSGVLNQVTPSLAAGERLVYTLDRSITGGSAGTSLTLGGAAFVDPSPASAEGRPERNYADNSTRVAVALVSNQPPQVPQPMAQTTSEDGAPVTIVYTVTDPESDSVGAPTISSNNTTLFPGTLTATSAGANQWSVTLTPAADKNGIATITASFTDGNSQPIQVQSSVTVTAVNDAPSFALNVSGAAITVTQGEANCGASGACLAVATAFVGGFQPGPAAATDETTQTVVPNTTQDLITGDFRLPADACRAAASGGVDPTTFFASGVLPRITNPSAGVYNLVGDLSRTVGAVECDITVIDNGAPAGVSAPQTLTIRYQTP